MSRNPDSQPNHYQLTALIATIILLSFIGLSNMAQAGHSPFNSQLEINENQDTYILGSNMVFLTDPSGELTVNQVASSPLDNQFQQHTKDVPNFGFTNDAFWFHTLLVNNSGNQQSLILEATSSWTDSIKLYTPAGDDADKWNELHVGDKLPFSQRPIKHQDFLLPITLEAHQSLPIYLRISSRALLLTPLTIWKKEVYEPHSRTVSLFFGLLFGILLIMFFYNMFIYFTVRDHAYLYYILFVFSTASMGFTSNGFTYMYLWPDSNWIVERVQVSSICLTQLGGILFARSFLDTKRIVPWMHHLLSGLLLFYTAILLALPFVSELAPFARAAVTAAPIYAPVLLITGLLALRKGVWSARFFLLGWTSSVVGLVVTAMTLLGVIPYSLITYNAAFLGVVVDIALLSFAMADRINVMRQEKESARQELTDTLHNSKEELTNRVDQRTAELATALDRADQANQAKSLFLSNISHELRTPLNAIIGFSRLLIKDRESTLSKIQKEFAEHINVSGNHLLTLIDDVLDLARIESGQFNIKIKAVPVCKVIQDARFFFNDQAKRKQLTISDITDESKREIYALADENRLRQVIINLLSNAIKYNNPGGRVVITLERHGPKVIISISDTGIGIPEEKLSELFLPFSRLGAEAKGIEGTGIGLSIARQLTEMMNGKINVESRVNVGTNFTITLSAANTPDKTPPLRSPSTHEEMRWGKGKTVLYIEDNVLNMKLIKNFLMENTDLKIFEATTAQEGVDIAFEKQPDLILSDIRLPDFDGYEVIKKLHANPKTKAIPIIAISASALVDDLKYAKEVGFSDYLVKPVDLEKLLKIMKSHLNHP
ncbi:MAG: response regulator [Gammaproteobacteria bacterium]|nr:response regulator [Gammaproteobacteria bacterium]